MSSQSLLDQYLNQGVNFNRVADKRQLIQEAVNRGMGVAPANLATISSVDATKWLNQYVPRQRASTLGQTAMLTAPTGQRLQTQSALRQALQISPSRAGVEVSPTRLERIRQLRNVRGDLSTEQQQFVRGTYQNIVERPEFLNLARERALSTARSSAQRKQDQQISAQRHEANLARASMGFVSDPDFYKRKDSEGKVRQSQINNAYSARRGETVDQFDGTLLDASAAAMGVQFTSRAQGPDKYEVLQLKATKYQNTPGWQLGEVLGKDNRLYDMVSKPDELAMKGIQTAASPQKRQEAIAALRNSLTFLKQGGEVKLGDVKEKGTLNNVIHDYGLKVYGVTKVTKDDDPQEIVTSLIQKLNTNNYPIDWNPRNRTSPTRGNIVSQDVTGQTPNAVSFGASNNELRDMFDKVKAALQAQGKTITLASLSQAGRSQPTKKEYEIFFTALANGTAVAKTRNEVLALPKMGSVSSNMFTLDSAPAQVANVVQSAPQVLSTVQRGSKGRSTASTSTGRTTSGRRTTTSARRISPQRNNVASSNVAMANAVSANQYAIANAMQLAQFLGVPASGIRGALQGLDYTSAVEFLGGQQAIAPAVLTYLRGQLGAPLAQSIVSNVQAAPLALTPNRSSLSQGRVSAGLTPKALSASSRSQSPLHVPGQAKSGAGTPTTRAVQGNLQNSLTLGEEISLDME